MSSLSWSRDPRGRKEILEIPVHRELGCLGPLENLEPRVLLVHLVSLVLRAILSLGLQVFRVSQASQDRQVHQVLLVPLATVWKLVLVTGRRSRALQDPKGNLVSLASEVQKVPGVWRVRLV